MAEAYMEYVINERKIFPTHFRRPTPQKRHDRGFENFGYVLLALPAGNLPSSLAILLKASGVNMSGRPITARRNNEITSHTVEWTRTGQSS
jgi:hypothetical protein